MVLGYALKAKSDSAVHACEDCRNFVTSSERDQGCRTAQAAGDFRHSVGHAWADC